MQIIESRLALSQPRDGVMWNYPPGALVTLPTFADSLTNYPFYRTMAGMGFELEVQDSQRLTAVIYVTRGGALTQTTPLYRLVRNVSKSVFTAKVGFFVLSGIVVIYFLLGSRSMVR